MLTGLVDDKLAKLTKFMESSILLFAISTLTLTFSHISSIKGITSLGIIYSFYIYLLERHDCL